MLEIIIGSILIAGVAAAVNMATHSVKDVTLDVLGDFNAIKSALVQFRKVNIGKCNNLDELKPYFDKKNMDLSHYTLSTDEKYLIVDTSGLKQSADELAELAGAYASVIGNKLYLSFISTNKASKVTAVAKIKYTPAEQIFTTTPIDYDPSESITENNVLSEVTWENNKRFFTKPGKHIVKLKVKDLNNNWSEWASTTIDVTEKPGFSTLSSGSNHICLVRCNGNVDCIGNNDYGQLGINSMVSQIEMTPNTFVERVLQVACGSNHTLFKTLDNTILSAGRNSHGQLGTGSRLDSKTPKPIVGLTGIKQIEAGNGYSAALTYDGLVYTWGDNEHGQLGTDKVPSRDTPALVEGVEGIMQISCGNDHVLALKFDKTVMAWGSNTYGQLAVGFKGKTMLPTQTELSHVTKVKAGKDISFALTEKGHVIACGLNGKSQLAQSTSREVVFPEEILGLKGIVDLQTKGNFTVAMDGSGIIYTWGQYNNLDETGFEKPTKLENIHFAKSIGATLTQGYALTIQDELIRWSSSINNLEMLISAKPTVTTETTGNANEEKK